MTNCALVMGILFDNPFFTENSAIRTGAIIGLLIGTYAPASGVIIAGINPHELNQTSYCISANHIKEML